MDNLFDSGLMHTFLFTPDDRDGDRIVLEAAEARHLCTVLRLSPGEMLRAIDGRGEAHICELVSAQPKQAFCRIIKTVRRSGEPALDVTLAAGLSSGTKFDAVIEKGTEVGISRFVPLLTEKGKVRVDSGGSLKRKLERWRRVSRAATKQSGRSLVPAIDEPLSFADLVAAAEPRETVLFHPSEDADDLTAFVANLESARLTLITGPESGFSPDELAAAKQRGLPTISLGPRILRTETAAVVFAALLIYMAETTKA